MSNLDMPVKEQAQPVPEEGATGTEERPPQERPQQATPTTPYERAWPTTPPTFIPSAQPPSPWPTYANQVGQPPSRSRPYAPVTFTLC